MPFRWKIIPNTTVIIPAKLHIPETDTFHKIAKWYPNHELIIAKSIDTSIVIFRSFVIIHAAAAGATKYEITKIPPTLLNATTQVTDTKTINTRYKYVTGIPINCAYSGSKIDIFNF